MDVIYLDNNASTMPLPEVVEAVQTQMEAAYANASSTHHMGQAARHAIETARSRVAALIGASPRTIVFTSGGTESISLALLGCRHRDAGRRKIVTTSVEHSAVLGAVEQLAERGFDVVSVGVDRHGRIQLDDWESAVDDQTALVSFHHANNETGVIQDISKLGQIARSHGALVHVDAVQTVAKIMIEVENLPVDLLSMSGHKFHGPQGTGALYIRRRVRVLPLHHGGAQESGLRGGTENTPAIAGMGVAAEVALREMDSRAAQISSLRERFETGIQESIPAAQVISAEASRSCHTSYIAFPGVAAEALLILLSEAGICASAGAACSSGSLEPSHVLRAMALDESLAHGSVRFSFSHLNTRDEVDHLLRLLPGMFGRLCGS